MRIPPSGFVWVAIVSIAVAGCNKVAEPQSREQATPVVSAAEPTAAKPTPSVGKAPSGSVATGRPRVSPPPAAGKLAIEWPEPKTWKRVKPKNRMRKASYQIAPAPGDTVGAELNVFYFGPRRPNGPDPVEANVQRWLGQFVDLKPEQIVRSKRKPDQLQQHLVEVKNGTFTAGGMMPGAGQASENPNYGLLGAIVESPAGDYFFKLTGPRKTVASAKKELLTLLDGIKVVK